MTCDIGTLGVEETVTLVIVVNAVDVGTASNTVEVASSSTDPNPENNMDMVGTLINPAIKTIYLPFVQK
ncbi:MAG: hypothetical protein WAV05_13605 [Anaerolineales bacterium]